MKGFRKPGLLQRIIYWIASRGNRVIFGSIWRLEVAGAENIPRTGAVILASNHISLADPPLIGGCVLSRSIYFFAKEELFRVPILGWFIRQVNAFPVKRFGHDVGAFKRARILLQNGQVVVLFPEGRRSKNGEIGRAKPGVGMLAIKMGVPVVPVCVFNTNKLLQLRKLKVSFGKPMVVPKVENERDQYQDFSDRVMSAIADMKSKMYNEFSSKND